MEAGQKQILLWERMDKQNLDGVAVLAIFKWHYLAMQTSCIQFKPYQFLFIDPLRLSLMIKLSE